MTLTQTDTHPHPTSFHMTLPKIEGITQVMTMFKPLYPLVNDLTKIDVLLTLDRKSDLGFVLFGPDYLRSKYVLTINGPI